jgi:hypothetical protein
MLGIHHVTAIAGDPLVLAKRDREPLQGRSRPKVSRDSLPGWVWNAVRSLENIQVRDLMKLPGRVKVGQLETVERAL